MPGPWRGSPRMSTEADPPRPGSQAWLLAPLVLLAAGPALAPHLPHGPRTLAVPGSALVGTASLVLLWTAFAWPAGRGSLEAKREITSNSLRASNADGTIMELRTAQKCVRLDVESNVCSVQHLAIVFDCDRRRGCDRETGSGPRLRLATMAELAAAEIGDDAQQGSS